jgi:hypothetical protein
MTASLPTAGQNAYYRLYEKILVPSAGIFVLVGSNMVQTYYPSVSAVTPSSGTVDLHAAVLITFAQAMNQASVEKGFQIASNVDIDPGIAGQFAWSGNTLTFTPTSWLAGRKYSLAVNNAVDALGNALYTPVTATFGVTSGYTDDATFAQTDLGKTQLPIYNGHTAMVRDAGRNFVISCYDPINGSSVSVFSPQGAFLRKWPVPAGLQITAVATDTGSNVYIESDKTFPSDIREYDTNGTPIKQISNANAATGLPFVVNAQANYILSFAAPWDYLYDFSGTFIKEFQLPNPSNVSAAGAALDGGGHLYVDYQGSVTEYDAALLPMGGFPMVKVSDPETRRGQSLALDTTGHAYVFWGLEVRKFDTSSGSLLTAVPLPATVTALYMQGLSCDDDGSVYVLTGRQTTTFLRFVPSP